MTTEAMKKILCWPGLNVEIQQGKYRFSYMVRVSGRSIDGGPKLISRKRTVELIRALRAAGL